MGQGRTMGGAIRKVKAVSVLRAAAISLLLGVGGCSSLGDFTGEDITKAASTGIGALVGAKPPEQLNREIELRARSPLVIPPDYNLRPPLSPSEEESQLSADWPADPDVKVKEAAALEAARAEAEYEKLSKSRDGRSAPMSPEELAAGIQLPSQEPQGPTGKLARVESSQAMTQEELLQRHRQQQQAERSGTGPQSLVVASQQATTRQAADGVQYQTQEIIEPPAPPPPPKKKSFFDRLIFWE